MSNLRRNSAERCRVLTLRELFVRRYLTTLFTIDHLQQDAHDDQINFEEDDQTWI